MYLELGINGVIKMPDNRKKIRRITGLTAGIWFVSLFVFLLYCSKAEKASIWGAAAYGVWNLVLFTTAYVKISGIVNRVMENVDHCIQSLIDGKPQQKFSMEEETLLGKFQMQIMKLYHIMNGAREAEEKMRKEMSEMISDLIHQVNTPLTNIQMYSGFLTQDDLPGEERMQICEVIDSQVEKLGWFAEGFGKTMRLEEDVMQVSPKSQTILPMVLGAIDQIALKAQMNENEILLRGQQNISAVYDRRWTEEAVFNLMDNAVKYGRRSSPITVEMTAYNLFVRIDVCNWGDLIPKEEYNKIFTRFYRGGNAIQVKEGVGLGLYLTRKIVSKQGGYVKVGADGKKGNIFSLFLKKA